MSTYTGGTAADARGLSPPPLERTPSREPVNYLNVSYGVKSWLLTVDHKRIALLYLVSLTVMFAIGGVFATLIRLGGLHYWWPKISGRLYPEAWARVAAIIIFVGFNLTFFPQFILGYLGMPRRYHAYPPEFQVLNVMSSAGASILAVGYVLPLVYLTWSMRYGRRAGQNPWDVRGLEWETASPPPTENFLKQPMVTKKHQYGSEEDAIVV